MVGIIEVESEETQRQDCSFVWDETTQLYYHASGFYHDPHAGWYYSSRDGLYYKFENGSYVLLESNVKVNECEIETHSCEGTVPDNSVQDETNALQCSGSDPLGHTECRSNQAPENPAPPSEWLEETLINLFLSGYNQTVNAADSSTMSLEMDGGDSFNFSADGNDDADKLQEGDWIIGAHCDLNNLGERTIDEGVTDVSIDKEKWQAQYGQVVHSEDEAVPDFSVIDLWDWAMVIGSRKDGKGEEARLVGRLVKQSAKLHPSMPSGGALFRTAPICEVRFDLVRGRTGQLYKLHTPSARYLASLSTYDSSNPTKDWGFPDLSNMQDIPVRKFRGKGEQKSVDGDTDSKGMPTLPNQLFALKRQRSHAYRDRAAERRTLHGGFGLGPGQMSSLVDDAGGSSSPLSTSTEEAAAEALNMSFGAGSYARKILESMGWKEGEALGNTTKGLIEPIQAVGNIGNAGLGWPQGRMKHQ